jgi:thiol-disulfide isomerase/thioredoxin
VLAAVGIALGAIVVLGHRRAASPPAPAITRPATTNGTGGSKAALVARVRSLRGHPIVLTVWASWCQPCRGQAGLIAGAARQYRHRVAFLGVDADDTRTAAASFLRFHPLGFPSFQSTLDLQPLLPQVLPGVPVTLYLSSDGKPVDMHVGEYISFSALARDIDAFSLHTRSTSPPNGNSLW